MMFLVSVFAWFALAYMVCTCLRVGVRLCAQAVWRVAPKLKPKPGKWAWLLGAL